MNLNFNNIAAVRTVLVALGLCVSTAAVADEPAVITDVLTPQSVRIPTSTNGKSVNETYPYVSEATGVSYSVLAANPWASQQTIKFYAKNLCGIVVTANEEEREATDVTIDLNDNTDAGKTLEIYGKKTPYASVEELYDTSTQGVALGSINCDAPTSLELPKGYTYIGVRPTDSIIFLNSLSVGWITPDTATGVEAVAEPNNAPSECYFDLTGRPVDHPTHGVYIRLSGTTATKVLLK